MKKAIIICAAGMSSSLMAKKTTDYLQENGHDIEITATTAAQGEEVIRRGDYDLYLISPQTKFRYDEFEKVAEANDRKITLIPFEAYVPIITGIKKLAEITLEHI